jgi:hypothetical protein
MLLKRLLPLRRKWLKRKNQRSKLQKQKQRRLLITFALLNLQCDGRKPGLNQSVENRITKLTAAHPQRTLSNKSATPNSPDKPLALSPSYTSHTFC